MDEIRFDDIEGLKSHISEEFGPWGQPLEVTQKMINEFAEVTGDHQWIHIDVERAKEGPFGGTIAHGFLTLSLLPSFMMELLRVDGLAMGVNYGLNKVRFPKPVPVGGRIRATGELTDVKGTPAGYLSNLKVTVELEGERRPVCIAETLSLYVPAP